MNSTPGLRTGQRHATLWREYWKAKWHLAPRWPSLPTRSSAFLGTKGGRASEPPVVIDSPTGKQPFLGVLTLGEDAKAAPDSGIVTFPSNGHLLTIAPTRTGKGTCHIVPNLLLYAGSTVVIDVKGENYDITAQHRRNMFPGARVIRFAPFSDDGERYNPLDFVRVDAAGRPNANTFEDSRLLAEMLLPAKPSNDAFWDIEARNLLQAVILYISCIFKPGHPKRNMASVADVIFQASGPATDAGAASTTDKGYTIATADMMRTAERLDYQPLRALASSLVEHEEKVRAGIFSTCRAEMKVWLSERVQKATEQSDFEMSELKLSMCRPIAENPAPTSLYIVVPPEYLKAYRTVLRTMIGLAIVELTRTQVPKQPGWRSRPPGPVLFLLDELPALGMMGPIVDGLSYLAGYDVQLWSFAQNIGQLKEIYGDAWHNFPANSGATAFFGVNDPDTAEYVERLLGETAERMVYYEHDVNSHTFDASRPIGQMSSRTSGTGISHRFLREKVISAAEIRALPEELQLIFIRNRPPILASKLPFYRFELIKGLAGQWLLGN